MKKLNQHPRYWLQLIVKHKPKKRTGSHWSSEEKQTRDQVSDASWFPGAINYLPKNTDMR